jgi:acetoin utilization protein AcuC
MGIGLSDNPPFAGMHEASAAVAGGSLRAIEAILRGDAEHAYHPGGGLHHAMAARASGFCIYDDPALAIVRARDAGLRVLYVDLDVHHGDGVQAICLEDPGALTVSFHESGDYLFPGTGFPDELGSGAAAGTSVNVPFEPFTGEGVWLAAVRSLVPALAAVFAPDVVVSQHGADSHAWDPLARLRVTTTAMGEAARLVDAVAHRWAGGRWLATGGGGYDVYRVVPRAWALTWLAGAHREAPVDTPPAWRERWSDDAASYGMPGIPSTFADRPNAGSPVDAAQEAAEARSSTVAARVRALVLPRLVREAEDRGWWSASAVLERVTRSSASSSAGSAASRAGSAAASPAASPTVRELDAAGIDRLSLATRVLPPFDPADAKAILVGAAAAGGRVVAAVAGTTIVGAAVAGPVTGDGRTQPLLAVGIAPAFRRAGLGRALLGALVDERPEDVGMEASVGTAERDVVEPLPVAERIAIARRLLEEAGFSARPGPVDQARDDRHAIAATLPPR